MTPTADRQGVARRLNHVRESVRRALLRRRRLLAASCAAVAVGAGISAAADPEPPSVPVVVAARDLPAGTLLEAADLTVREFRPGSEPGRLVEQPAGRVLAAPLTAGEAVTDVRLVGPGLADGRAGLSAVPVRLPDPGMVALLRVGDVIDLVAADPQGGAAATVATAVPVLALTSADPAESTAGLPGRLVVLGLDDAEVRAVAASTLASFVTFRWSRR